MGEAIESSAMHARRIGSERGVGQRPAGARGDLGRSSGELLALRAFFVPDDLAAEARREC